MWKMGKIFPAGFPGGESFSADFLKLFFSDSEKLKERFCRRKF